MNTVTCMLKTLCLKDLLLKKKSSLLWHKILDRISNERVDRLIKDGILLSLDFGNLDTCIDYIRGKLTKTKKNGATCSFDLLEIVHTDISRPLISTLCGDMYFVTFIGDFPHCGYLYLIKEKSDAFENLKFLKLK